MNLIRNNDAYAYNILKGATGCVELIDGRLMLRTPLNTVFPVEAYDYFQLPNGTCGCLILSYTYIKWSVFYSIHPPRKKHIDGYHMFKERPDSISISYIPYLDSYAVLTTFKGKKYTSLMTTNKKADSFIKLWASLLAELQRSTKSSLWFEGLQAKFSEGYKEYDIDWIDCDTYDIQLKLHAEDEARVFQRCAPRVELPSIINLYRGGSHV